MIFNATLMLNEIETRELICQALKTQGIEISHQDIEFQISKEEKGNQIDSWVEYNFSGLKIKGVKIQ